MRNRTRKIYWIVGTMGTIIALAIVLFFVFRETLLDKAISRIAVKMQTRYDTRFTVTDAGFEGLSGVRLTGVSLVPADADTLLHISQLKTSVRLLHLITGNVQLGTLELKNGFIQLIRNQNGRNFDAFLKNKNARTSDLPAKKRDYAHWVHNLLSNALDLIPTDMALENLSFRINDNGKKATVVFQKLRLADKQLDTDIFVQTNTFTQRWKISGLADPRHSKADLRFFNRDTGAIKVPYFDERFNLIASFDSIRLNVDNIDLNSGELHLDGFTSITNLHINHAKIASKDVVIQNARFDYRFLLGEDFISIDSSSTVQLNKIKFRPFLSYATEKDTVYQLKIVLPKMQAQDFIVSLPDGLFTNFQGMQAEGNFSYALDFMFNKNQPQQLVFDSRLNKEHLKILKYGAANLSKLNSEFIYRAVDNGKQQRAVVVGPSNPNFTPLDAISPYLRKAVLTTEDPSFFSHRGFISEAFRQSIIQNIKTKKFSRGASTISMQLVKNAFLTREKTLSRKLEEILLVYILENNRIASKERMLEVYFNIIEWGPNIYGIGEASRFYFQKHPSELSLNECIFLANIIPRPKGFMWQFNNTGNLRDFIQNKQQYLTNLMLRRGLLSAEDTLNKSFPVYISGPARSYIRITEQDSIPVDSLQIDAEFDF